MQKIINKKTLTFFLVVLIGLVIRLWHYEYFPVGGETADESAWTLLGASLIQTKIPASWSFFSAYDNYHYAEGIYNAPIVRPVFDHPPLFSLLPGMAHSIKAFWLDLPSFKVIRLPLVLLGAVNVGIFWLLASRIFSKKEWVWLATGLFATIPTLVFGSRLVVAENLLVTWILLTLYVAAGKWTKNSFWWLAGISLLAVLTKIAGLIVPASLVIYGLFFKKRPIALAGLVGALAGISSFTLYGAVYNWSLFRAVLADQSGRELGLATLQNRLFLNPTVVRFTLFDGWKIAGLLATFWALGQKWKNQSLFLAQIIILISFLFIALSVGEATFHGWYDFVLWPSLVLNLTLLIKYIWETRQGVWFGLVWLFLLPAIRLALVFAGGYDQLPIMVIRLIILAGFMPLGWQALGQKHLVRWSIGILLVALLISNVVAIATVTHEAYWIQASFFELPQ